MKKVMFVLVAVLLISTLSTGQESEILQLKEKIIAIQNQGELGFQNFVICSKIISFGSYIPLPEAVVDKNGSLLIYFEPQNIFTNKRDGLYEIYYTQDMILLDDTGKELLNQKDALVFHYTTKKPVMDLFAQNTVDIKGQLPAGKYSFKAVLKDQLSGKTATKIIEFELR